MELKEIVMKLVGPIEPVGGKSEDDRRLENLKALCDLVNSLLFDIDSVAADRDHDIGSISRAGEYAHKQMSETFGVKD